MIASALLLELENRARRHNWKGPGRTLFLADQRRFEAVDR